MKKTVKNIMLMSLLLTAGTTCPVSSQDVKLKLAMLYIRGKEQGEKIVGTCKQGATKVTSKITRGKVAGAAGAVAAGLALYLAFLQTRWGSKYRPKGPRFTFSSDQPNNNRSSKPTRKSFIQRLFGSNN